MNLSYHTIRVLNGEDPDLVLEAMVLQRVPIGSDSPHIYVPDFSHPARHLSPGTGHHGLGGEDKSLTNINNSWIHDWHRDNPDYYLNTHSSVLDEPIKSEFTNYSDEQLANQSSPYAGQRHHEISSDVREKRTGNKVGDFSFSLGRWPLMNRGPDDNPQHTSIVTAHVHSFFRHIPDKNHFQYNPAHGRVMTNMLDSWVNHVQDHGVNHGYINYDISDGYWLSHVTRHPDMTWGGVEFKSNKTHSYAAIKNRDTARDDFRGSRLIRNRQDLFKGWPGFDDYQRHSKENLGLDPDPIKESDAFILRWNQEHPKVNITGGPIPTHLMKFENGSLKNYPAHFDRACYHHAVRNFKRNSSHGMKIAIGFIVKKTDAESYERDPDKGPPLMFTHAFNVNRKGQVHDSTLGPENIDSYRYYGHVVPDEVASTMKSGNDLANWFGRHFQVGHNRGPSPFHLGQQVPITHDRGEE